MSKETAQWLNTMTLIGNTDQRGNAWHYRAELQGDESNHYPGAIPTDDIKRRLFNFDAVPRRVAVEVPADMETMTHLSEDGSPMRWTVQLDRQAMCPDDTHDVLGMFKSGYKAHQFGEWLVDNVETILPDAPGGLGASSAGLLKNRAVAWVEVSVPDTIKTPEGVEFRPNLLAATSLDGTLATQYRRTVQLTVCDNTMAAALSEKGQVIKKKHTSNSLGSIDGVREALAILDAGGESFTEEVARLCRIEVPRIVWKDVINTAFPLKDGETSKATITNAENRRGELDRMYRYDPRVEPWSGTAFGVVQAFNTWRHHEQNGLSGESTEEKRRSRVERNQLRAVKGETEVSDLEIMELLSKSLAKVDA